MRKLATLLLVVCLVLPLAGVLPVLGEQGNESKLEDSQGARRGSKTLYVGGSGSGNYSKIQDAINNASAGDTIRVYAGTYYENLTVNKTVTLIGNGTEYTTINYILGIDSCIIKIDANWVNITGFTILNSSVKNTITGIRIANSNHCRIENCNLLNNTYDIKIYYSSTNTIVENNTFRWISVGGSGNMIANNTGGRINVAGSKNIIYNNICSSYYTGIDLFGGAGNRIIKNKCTNSSYGIIGVSLTYNIIDNNNCSDNYIGIHLYGTGKGITLVNNTCNKNDDYGILLYAQGLNNIMIENNTCNSNKEGIHQIWGGPNDLIIRNNTCNWNTDYGIYFESLSSSSEIENNTCNSNNKDGIRIIGSNTFVDNTCNSNNQNGIYSGGTWNENTFVNNTCNSNNQNGIYGSGTIYDNTCDYNNENGISGSGTIYDNHCYSNNGTGITCESNNILVNNNCSFNNKNGIECDSKNILENNYCSGNDNGIYLGSSSNYNTLNKNYCSENNNGIYLEFSSSNTLKNNNCLDNKNGMYFENSDSNVVTNNICNLNNIGTTIYSSSINTFDNNTWNTNTNHGIYINESENNYIINSNISSNHDCGICLLNSINIIIDNNTCSNNDVGIKLENNSDYNIVVNNKCNSNTKNGINLDYSSLSNISNNICDLNYNGISLELSSNKNTLENNIVNSNNNYGFYISEAENNTINNNNISSNRKFGVYITSAVNNNIYNNFFDNINQAYDDSNNIWNLSKPTGGNYWSDWTSPDVDNDGFVDKSYNIFGSAHAKDHLPFVKPSREISLHIDTKNVQLAYVGHLYSVNYTAFDSDTPNNELIWTMNTNASWLNFSVDQELYGTPEISDIGSYWVNLTVTDGDNLYYTNFTLTVLGTIPVQPKEPPNINTQNVIKTYVGKNYSVNYTATDPDTQQVDLTWSMSTNATWLNFSSSQELFGTPENTDVGLSWIKISVSDGYNIDFTNFTIEVKAYGSPIIITIDKLTAYVDLPYSAIYTAEDPDTAQNDLSWTMNTNASWLDFSSNQQLSGTPEISDMGSYWVHIEVSDGSNSDFNNFTISVLYDHRPRIDSTFPEDNSTNIPINNTQITITFSTPMNRSSVEEALFVVPAVNYNLTWDDNSTELKIIFDQNLSYNTIYKITINTSAKDIFGNQFNSRFEFIFTTQIESKPGGDNGKPKNGNFILRIIIASFLVLVLIVLIIFGLITKRRRKIKERREEKTKRLEGRSEVKGLDITEKYPYDELVIGKTEDYIKKLMDESLEFKKPSEFKTPEEKMLKEAKEKYRKGKISKATYESITETLIEKKH